MKDHQKGSITQGVIAIMALLLIVGGVYWVAKNKVSAPSPVATSTPPVATIKTYTNSAYGFTFNYPSTWTLTESTNGNIVEVIADTSTKDSTYEINFSRVYTAEFNDAPEIVKQTKYGDIRYDASKQTLVDVSSNPPRCLSVNNPSLLTPGIEYGGSMMSSPAHFESVILTNKNYMILVKEVEDSPSSAIDQIRASFKFINGVQVRIPNCSSSTPVTPPPVGPLHIISPNGGEVWHKGTSQTITWTAPQYFRATYADIKITQKYECTGQVCPMIAYAPSTIVGHISIDNHSYTWKVGEVVQYIPPTSEGTYPTPSPVLPDGKYTIQICETGADVCDASDRVFTITQ